MRSVAQNRTPQEGRTEEGVESIHTDLESVLFDHNSLRFKLFYPMSDMVDFFFGFSILGTSALRLTLNSLLSSEQK